MLLRDVVSASASVAATRSRTEKVVALADALARAATHGGDEVAVVAAYLSGILPQRRIGVGWRALASVPPPAQQPTLTVLEVDAALAGIGAESGPGSAGRRSALLTGLLGRATAPEQSFLRGLLAGEVRQGALDGVMQQAVARAAGVPEAAVRRAVMLAGHAGPVARAALTGGLPELTQVRLEVGRPMRPMLASSAPDVDAAVAAVAATKGAPFAVEVKVDGVRVQIHKSGPDVRVFTRSLEDITDRVPEVASVAAALPADRLVMDGEAVALDRDGRPLPFQVTGARAASALPAGGRPAVPLTTFLFDVLHRDGADLMDLPLTDRIRELEEVVPAASLMPRLVTDNAAAASRFFADGVASGHEGVVVKSLATPYAAGRRGAGWVKVKPRHTLDLVVLAVEWGSGRRRGWLSNIHLGALDPGTGGFVMLGKTFKGMTDEILAWQTRRFLELETSRSGQVVHVRPEQVVEVAFDGVQTSSRYPGGMALRFARVVRYRQDKTAAEADTVDAVRALHAAGARASQE